MIGLKFEEVRDELRKWREDNSRQSEEVVDRWTYCLQHNKNKLGDERWMVEEQVFVAALDCNRMDIADQCLHSLAKKFPNSLRVAKLKGMRLEALEKFDDALQIYERIVREDETNSTARKRRIAVLRGQRRYVDAIKELNEYLQLFMSDWEAWQELLDLYLKEGDYAKAAFCMEELLMSNPHNAIYYTRYAEVKYTQGGLENMEIAKTYFGQAVKLNPKNIRALFGLQLSCEQIASSPKTTVQKKKEAIRVAEYASQLIKQRYAALSSPASTHGDQNLVESLSALTVGGEKTSRP
ncbi:ER membrane protein complex subunit 2 [Hyalella azteca]|uniref:ER membrane protein complex subunit 2 n=1 Tax=Hyalella azteca TaxID=294128 RepID=A0A8B7NDR2_HYAAZ|nr:ER membrane protein complex subunit 2 [Hyalella azteca]